MGEKYKDVEINGRKFRIRKFSARDGSYILIKVMSILAPMFQGLDLNQVQNVKDVSDVASNGLDVFGMIAKLITLSESDFNYIQEKCLRVCSEHLPSGFVPVLNDNGSFGVLNLEDDTVTVLALTAHALIFNLQSFFAGSPLQGLVGGLLATPQ
ncbi:phage tail assembly chaperone [Alicyclobacillus macrosporangiidus]|uniref:Uncharacterized protein n=1 Tax=Alicyclobacillus macrosporangiidus TaxID=392015 RepID=A0A1I7IE41_9BACL|nr:hypothetical protein [Alicyclobacillus macrosporangiidus]SFU71158.1 hypothetical protein SAMN05421543_106163 [Alicyclobacillus macrosporangiidus]